MPPTAPMHGNKAFFKLDKLPCTNSRFISRPTVKKNNAIRPSLTQWCRDIDRFKAEGPMFLCNIALYKGDKLAEFARKSAIAVAQIKIIEPKPCSKYECTLPSFGSSDLTEALLHMILCLKMSDTSRNVLWFLSGEAIFGGRLEQGKFKECLTVDFFLKLLLKKQGCLIFFFKASLEPTFKPVEGWETVRTLGSCCDRSIVSKENELNRMIFLFAI